MSSTDMPPAPALIDSPIYWELSRRISGLDLCTFSMITPPQFEALLDALAIQPDETCLDVGCGRGRIAVEVARRSKGKVLAIDRDPLSITAARRHYGSEVDYEEANFDQLSWDGPRFDVIYAIDTLYFSKALPETVKKLVSLLKDGGRLGIFWSQAVKEDVDRKRLEPEHTVLAEALQAAGAEYSWQEFSDEDAAYWKRAVAVHADIGKQLADVHPDYSGIQKALNNEAHRLAKVCEEGRSRRYLYLVRK